VKREYYSRGKKITITEIQDVIAVKLREDSVEKRMDKAKSLGSRAELFADKAHDTLLNKEREAFEKAGYVFIKPNEEAKKTIASKSSQETSGITNAGSIFVDQYGHIQVGTRKITIKFKPNVTDKEIHSLMDQKNLTNTRQFKFADKLYEVLAQNGKDPLELSLELNNDEKVVYAEPVFNQYIEQRYRPSDPQYAQQWQWMGGIHTEEAWESTKGEGIKVAVIDNGIDVSNPDLSKSIAYAGYFQNMDDTSGEIALSQDLKGFPISNHGTFCSGMAVARADNNSFGCGAAHNASFIPIACLPDQVGAQETLARAVSYSADPTVEVPDANPKDGADIISCSLGPNGGHWTMTSILEEAINFAATKGRNGLGTAIFWAVDNTSQPVSEDEVCSHPHTIAVGRSRTDDMEDGSAYGPELDFLAPGVDVYNIHPNGGFSVGTGTSYATPCAAGIGALVLATNTKLSWTQLRKILRDTCDKVGNVDYGSQGHHPNYGYGRINAASAVKAAKNYVLGEE
jgi:subtilisin family serine protease